MHWVASGRLTSIFTLEGGEEVTYDRGRGQKHLVTAV
jgi:hypothetical protein